MIVAFDLDDTLYPERDYVESGFRAVAERMEASLGADPDDVFARLVAALDSHPRGRQLDVVLQDLGAWNRRTVDDLIRVYRHHRPAISLPPSSAKVLRTLRTGGHRLYLVTDGHKVVQARKVEALGIEKCFQRCYLTNRYGRASNKPSTRVFELMLRRERATSKDLAYIGDDPSKDFIGVRALGGTAIRVKTGRFAQVESASGHEPTLEIEGLEALPPVIAALSSP